MGEGVGNWDGHKTIKTQYPIHAKILDQACARLLQDLKDRGMLERTLVVWVTEFGRMPTFQKGGQRQRPQPQRLHGLYGGGGGEEGI